MRHLSSFHLSALNMFFRRKKESLFSKYQNYTMIPLAIFEDNIMLCTKYTLPEGDIVECGVWRGGMIAALSELLGNNRMYHLFDSFEGLPKAQEKDGEWAKKWQDNKNLWYFDNCRAEQEYATEAMKMAGCVNYKIYKGWFKDTLSSYSGKSIAILRLDGDWYDSTYQCLEELYPKVADNGLIIVDDYYAWAGCIRAIYDYFSLNHITDRIRSTPNGVCYIIKNEPFPFELALKK